MRAAASDFAADLLDVYEYLERMDEIGLPRLAFVGSRLLRWEDVEDLDLLQPLGAVRRPVRERFQ